MNAQSVRIVVWLTAVMAWCVPASAQGVSYSTPIFDVAYQVTGTTLTWQGKRKITGAGTPEPVLEFNASANVSDLDLDAASGDESGNAFVIRIYCKGHSDDEPDLSGDRCYSETQSLSVPRDPRLSYSDQSNASDRLDIWCATRAECQGFLAGLKTALHGPVQVPAPPRVSRPVVTPGPAASDKIDKRLPEESAAQKQANALLEESRKLLKQQACIAAMSTYRSGPQRDLPPGCLSDIDQMSVYRSSPGSPQPSGLSTEPVIDGSDIPSQIDFTKRAIDRVFVGPPAPPAPTPQPPSGGSSDLNSAPNTQSTTLTPTYDSTTRSTSSATSDDGPTAKLEVLPTHPPEPSTLERWMDKLGIGAPKPGPMHQAGAPDDTLENHQADMDKATNGWNYIFNPLKYPLEIQRVVNDKIKRILIPIWPEDK